VKRLVIIAAALAMPLAGCATTLPPSAGQAPAPLASTRIDDTALEAADKAFDAFLDGINLAKDICKSSTAGACGIVATGSPSALKIADAIDKVNQALAAADLLADAGSTTSYLEALAKAKAGIDELRALIGRQ
jgi:hypothetical protein